VEWLNISNRVSSSWMKRPASPRSYRVQTHKQTHVCPHGEEVHARKWKLYAATQDSPYGMNCLRPLKHWDRGFESHSRHGCLCTFILYLCCPLSR
jgi:hypothetical protein